MKKLVFGLLASAAMLAGCASPSNSLDYAAFENAAPTSILVLPPINNSPEVMAPYGLLAQIAAPIAESGYYVFPVALVYNTFKENGLTVANDIHAVDYATLKSVFGADTALYVTIEEYGTSYVVLSSDTVVSASAILVDLSTGERLWTGSARASSAEQRSSDDQSLAVMLIGAAVNQIVETLTDKGFEIAGIAANRMLSSESYNGLLYGPRSPKYGQPVVSQRKQ
ncbi:DUF799 domain-containing protein [Bowmanella pacifica]|uniref:Lipoprotein n=1 Tax=Bowmanella pacifica TaxID=502051 RepID=A0A917YSP4_9ALTE|nr:DUF799 domain-containing protein [Bowmanella pacifica]GGO65859.1 lipoprotein [Bowmanella pacifica]